MFCAEWALVKIQFQTATVLPLKCKCWTCDECRPGRTKRLVEEAKSGAPTLFITLTSKRRQGLTPSEAAVLLSAAWTKVRRELLRERGKGSLAFLAVFEATKRGWPHLHIVARCKYIDQKWLSRRMAALHDSPVVDVRKIHGVRKVAAYVSKYVGKNPHRFDGVKRYWRSRDYLTPPPPDDPDPWAQTDCWDVVRRFWLFLAQDLERDGWNVDTQGAIPPPWLGQAR